MNEDPSSRGHGDRPWGHGPRLRASLRVERLDLADPPGAILDALARQSDPVLLDSAALHETYGRYTIAACRPLRTITLRDGVLSDSGERILADTPASLWAALAEALGSAAAEPSPQAPYCPGWIGYVGYEVGRWVERLPGKAVRDTHLPDLRLGFYDAILLYDALERSWRLVELVFDGPDPAGAGEAAKILRRLAATAGDGGDAPPAPAHHAEAAASELPSAESNFTPEEYRRAVARCVEYIAAGDIFQVNLSQRFRVARPAEPPAIYRCLRRRNPAWYGAYLAFADGGRPCAILSSSPELFLRVRGGHVVTRPIKGTRPRVGQEQADAQAAAELLASPKDNAELAMIIDLLRNDLGRVCRFGTVRVTEPRRLETHPTVFHLVGTVEGDLREGVGPAELLQATFPGGSVTGAPKIRSMEIIDELEGLARGAYTGCIGIVGADGGQEWNIVIRTIVCDGEAAYVQVGGGIVADSQPEAEYRETLDKARAVLEALAESIITPLSRD